VKLLLSEIAKAVGGRLLTPADDITIRAVSTDTRTIDAAGDGVLFVPVIGENFDGHNYLAQAAEKGAAAAFSQVATVNVGIPTVYVANTRQALMDLAGYYRRLHGVRVVAVTGSAGKTTTKDMMASIFARVYRTKKTMGNFNNDIGMPLSIFRLETDDKMLVLEMGMNHGGEIHKLSLAGVPDIAIITHIGDAHIENFENREGILHAKLEIIDGLRPGGKVILNGDDPLLTGAISREKTQGLEVLYPSSANILQADAIGLTGTRCLFSWNGTEIHVTVPLPGAHMVMNALLATVAALEMNVPADEITRGFDDFAPPAGRLTVEQIAGMTIINDVYNANPQAMCAAIDVLCKEQGRKVAILGDMAELGQVGPERHRDVGEAARKAGVDLLIAIGPISQNIADGYGTGALHYHTVEQFLTKWRDLLHEGDIVLVKASRSMQFEAIIEVLGALPQTPQGDASP
jgi:UDP-N-acetylmuramoyl-tripeptide--D-alanyl-D-alanine ligase